jgi:hypothetical protein
MSSQQLADILLAHWQNLWPLPPSERVKVIDQIRADYEYEEQLRRVEREMGKCVIFYSDLPPHLSAAL